MSVTRRHFLTLTGGAALAWDFLLAGTPEESPNYKMADHWWGMLIDVTKCIGSGNCVRACAEENDVPDGFFRTWVEHYHVNDWHLENPVVESLDGGMHGFPVVPEGTGKDFFIPKMCNHCADSPCTQVCPVGATFVTPDPGLDINRVRAQVARLQEKCRERNILFDFRPKVHPQLMDSYYTPGAELEGRCLYPFLHARVSFSGKVYFCPFIRVEVGDLTTSSLEEVWNSEKYVSMRKQLVEHGIFPVCRRCCKVELSPVPLAEPFGAGVPRPTRRAIPLTVVR